MHRKMWGIAALLLAGCQSVPTAPPVTATVAGQKPADRAASAQSAPAVAQTQGGGNGAKTVSSTAGSQPIMLLERSPLPSVPPNLTGVAGEIGPKSTGPSAKGVQDIVQFFKTLNLEPGQTAPNLTAQAMLAQLGVRALKAVRFSLVVTLADGSRQELFAAALDATGSYQYTQADLTQIQQRLAALGEITAFDFEFFGPEAVPAATPLARVQPRLSARKDDDYVLECDIPEEDDDKFYRDAEDAAEEAAEEAEEAAEDAADEAEDEADDAADEAEDEADDAADEAEDDDQADDEAEHDSDEPDDDSGSADD